MKSLILAMAMYSKIPMPYTEWDNKSTSYVFCFFPVVGLVCGGALAIWFLLVDLLQINNVLFGVIATMLPLFVTGGIHLDGFCDTCDALGSNQPKERKLEILKDSHIGAFAMIGCVCYLLISCALWTQITICVHNAVVLCLVPVISRVLSGFCAVTMNNARGSGLLASFTVATARKTTLGVLGVWFIVAIVCMAIFNWVAAICVAAMVVVVYLYYRHMAQKQFGGITGDLEGWVLQICEICCLAVLVVVQQIGVVL